MTKVTENNNNSKKFKKVLISVFKKLTIKTYKSLGGQGFKMRILKMTRITKKALMSLARSLNAIDLTYDHNVRKGCECLTEVAYSAGVYGCNGRLFEDQDRKFYVVTDRTPALWVYGA